MVFTCVKIVALEMEQSICFCLYNDTILRQLYLVGFFSSNVYLLCIYQVLNLGIGCRVVSNMSIISDFYGPYCLIWKDICNKQVNKKVQANKPEKLNYNYKL